MVDFARSSEWAENDLLTLVREGVEGNINLEYKRCASLQKRDLERKELSKDISAFANSAGGIIVYGMIEENNKPTGLDEGYDSADISKEWVEQVIQGNIRPRIAGIHINPIALSGERQNRYAYVVTIPPGKTAHQAADLKYYKRFNFESVAMYDYEIRDIMSRFTYPLVSPLFSLSRIDSGSSNVHKYKLNIVLQNRGATCAREAKLIFYWLRPFHHECGSGYRQKIVRGRITVPSLETENVEMTILPFNRSIFPEDEFRLTDEDSRLDFRFSVDEAALNTILTRNPQVLWTIYADDMPPQKGNIPISEMPGFSTQSSMRHITT